jgi:hypothetical protein
VDFAFIYLNLQTQPDIMYKLRPNYHLDTTKEAVDLIMDRLKKYPGLINKGNKLDILMRMIVIHKNLALYGKLALSNHQLNQNQKDYFEMEKGLIEFARRVLCLLNFKELRPIMLTNTYIELLKPFMAKRDLFVYLETDNSYEFISNTQNELKKSFHQTFPFQFVDDHKDENIDLVISTEFQPKYEYPVGANYLFVSEEFTYYDLAKIESEFSKLSLV